MTDTTKGKLTLGGIETETRLHPVLSNEEYNAARSAARKKLDDQQKKAALKQVEEVELQRLKEEEGLSVGGVQDEIVDVTIDLAEYSGKTVLDNKVYWHGRTYTVPRHIAASIAEIIFRTHRHQELEIDGKNLTQHAFQRRNTTISPRGVKGGTIPQSAA